MIGLVAGMLAAMIATAISIPDQIEIPKVSQEGSEL